MKIYTRTGDAGETSLLGGKRVSKGERRIALYGDVDELNCHLGHLLSLLPENKKLERVRVLVLKVQHSLFNLGSILACEADQRKTFQLKGIDPQLVASLEREIDQMNEELPTLKNFILPGGPSAVSYAHVARAFTRKVERKLVSYHSEIKDPDFQEAIVFVNRLSDYLFTVARYINHCLGADEIIWKT